MTTCKVVYTFLTLRDKTLPMRVSLKLKQLVHVQLKILFEESSSILFLIISCLNLECIPGYFGSCCKYACRYPNYGKECQLKCVCAEENCNHIIGCVQRSNAHVIFFYKSLTLNS